MDKWGSDSCRGRFSVLQNIQTSYEAQPASYLRATRVHLQGKAAEVLGYHSPPPGGRVMNESSYTSAPLVCLNIVKRDNFKFTLFIRMVVIRCLSSQTYQWQRHNNNNTNVSVV